MLIYEKMKDGVRRLFGTKANVPGENDTQLTYKKEDGTVVELTKTSQLKDDGRGGMKLNGERVIAWMGNESVIPKGETPAKVLQSIAWTKAPNKTNYQAGESLQLEGAEITATYNVGDPEVVTSKCTFNPAQDAMLTNETKVVATYNGKTAEQAINVTTINLQKTDKTKIKEDADAEA